MTLSVALVQLDARAAVEANITTAVRLADEAARGGSRFVALPEYLHYRGSDDGFRASARPIPGPHTKPFSDVARRHGAWILVGSTAEASPDPARPYNTSALIAPDGSVAAVYRKVHLFDVAVDAGPVDTESARVTAGDRLVTADVDGAIVGLSICYDLRFPELYRALALAGAQILTVPSAFTERTGSRPLGGAASRARHRECRVCPRAVADRGATRSDSVRTFPRHRPWGTIVAQAPDVVGIVRAELDVERVASIRRQIPVLANRRLRRLSGGTRSGCLSSPVSGRTGHETRRWFRWRRTGLGTMRCG